MIFLSGDTHGETTHLLRRMKIIPRDIESFLIILGDFGFIWDNFSYRTIKYITRWINDNRPLLKLLFISGNHENFNLLEQIEEVEMFGNKVGFVSERIFHLKTGRDYLIDNQKFLVFGGALSIDKHERKLNKSYWEQEIPTYDEMQDFVDLLDSLKTEEYILLTHTTSDLEITYFDKFPFTDKLLDPVANYLKFIKQQYTFKYSCFGHFHLDKNVPEIKSMCIYKEIVNLDFLKDGDNNE